MTLFFYRFDALVVNSLTLSMPCESCHSVFVDDLKVNCYSVLASDLWISRDIAFLTIPCVGHDSIFFYRFDASVVNSLTLSIPYGSCHSVFIGDFKVYCYSLSADDFWISGDIAFLTIPCVGDDSICSIDLMRRSWIHWCCRFHAVAVTQYSLMISRSTVTLFWPVIYRSAVT